MNRATRRRSSLGAVAVRPRGVALVLAGLLALVAPACGNDEWSTEAPASLGNARATVQTWLTLCANGNGEGALEPLTPPERETILKAPGVLEGCEQVAGLAPSPSPPPPQLKSIFEETRIESVEVSAGFGTAKLRSPTGTTSELDLELDRGEWALSHPELPTP